MYDNHTCGIDCQLVTNVDGSTGHMMYPSQPTDVAGRYQFDQNKGITRRQWRQSGQDETRNCRVWAAARKLEISLRSDVLIRDMGDTTLIPRTATTERSIRRHIDDGTWVSEAALAQACDIVERVATEGSEISRGGLQYVAI